MEEMVEVICFSLTLAILAIFVGVLFMGYVRWRKSGR
jgi:hypothetical protein